MTKRKPTRVRGQAPRALGCVTIEFELPHALAMHLVLHSRDSGVNANELVRRALTRYLFDVRRIERARVRAKPVKRGKR